MSWNRHTLRDTFLEITHHREGSTRLDDNLILIHNGATISARITWATITFNADASHTTHAGRTIFIVSTPNFSALTIIAGSTAGTLTAAPTAAVITTLTAIAVWCGVSATHAQTV